MKRIITLIFVITLILTFSTFVFGATPVGFGAKAAAMGGAFTAVADDGSAAYWNPAGISQLGFFTLTPGAGIYGSYDPNFDFNSMSNSNTFPPPIPNGSIGIPIFAGITTKYVGANIFTDLSTLTMDDSEFTRIYADGSVYGTITGAASFGNLMVGASYKIVQGAMVKYKMIQVNQDPAYLQSNPEEVLKLTDPNNNNSLNATGNGYALDVGVILKLSKDLKLGFMGRNLLSSVNWSGTSTAYTIDTVQLLNNTVAYNSVETPYSATTSLPRTFAVGLAYRPYKSSLLAVDAEIITSDDVSFNQTRLHFGFEQTALWNVVALRLGAFTDKNEASLGLTAGLGFKAGPVLIDLTAIKVGDSGLGIFAGAGFKF